MGLPPGPGHEHWIKMQIVDMSVKSAPTTTHTPGETESGWENYGAETASWKKLLVTWA